MRNDAGVNPVEYLERQRCGDWGEMPPADARENDLSLRAGLRVLSSYRVGDRGETIRVITEADRSSTCLLLP